jgi:hypothetical protein
MGALGRAAGRGIGFVAYAARVHAKGMAANQHINRHRSTLMAISGHSEKGARHIPPLNMAGLKVIGCPTGSPGNRYQDLCFTQRQIASV